MLTMLHPAGGYFEFVTGHETVALRCHWPADLNADDWIDIQNDYHIPNYRRVIDDVMSHGKGEARGISGGYLKVTTIADGFFVEFSRPQDGWAASSLGLRVPRPISEFRPDPQ